MFGVSYLVSFKRACGHFGQYKKDGSVHGKLKEEQLEAEENAKPCKLCDDGVPCME